MLAASVVKSAKRGALDVACRRAAAAASASAATKTRPAASSSVSMIQARVFSAAPSPECELAIFSSYRICIPGRPWLVSGALGDVLPRRPARSAYTLDPVPAVHMQTHAMDVAGLPEFGNGIEW